MRRFSSAQISIFVIYGVISIFIFSGFYRQYQAIWTELFTMLMFFLSGVGLYISLRKIGDDKH